LSAAAILIYVTLAWLLSLGLRDSGIMDVLWGPGFIIATAAVAFASAVSYDTANTASSAFAGFPDRWILATSLVAIWGTRLAVHIGNRNRGKPEDYRYAAWRSGAGASWWWRSLFKVFLLQGFVMWVVAAPLVFVYSEASSMRLTGWDFAGATLWLFGFLFETISDEQLRRFKAEPGNAGAVMDRGLWRYARHPNYFGEAVLWWGLWLIACAVPLGWVSIVSPTLLTYLLLRVSGVTMLERGLMSTKPGYVEYRSRTNAFFPGRPRKP
jgi:steroid 5-alpha reductase family enzyme